MNKERSAEIEFLRGELVGPARAMDPRQCTLVTFSASASFREPENSSGTLFWRQDEGGALQEVVCYRGETPLQRYGAGLLHPQNVTNSLVDEHSDQQDSQSKVPGSEAQEETVLAIVGDADLAGTGGAGSDSTASIQADLDDDFEVTSADPYQPSVMGISFCVDGRDGEVVIELPPEKHFFWQLQDASPFLLNGFYEQCSRIVQPQGGSEQVFKAWRRMPATTQETCERFSVADFQDGRALSRRLGLTCGLDLEIELYPRMLDKKWVITCVLRNCQDASTISSKEARIRGVLFQAYFQVRLEGAAIFSRYPEGTRPFEQFDQDEQTLALLYRNAATWAIGHGCAAGWDAQDGSTPCVIFADVMPAVELPSMTPDIKDADGRPISLSMRALADLFSQADRGQAWQPLDRLVEQYQSWINSKKQECSALPVHLQRVADRHLDACTKCLDRISKGLSILKMDPVALEAFSLANQAMLLQQVASKQVERRPLARFDNYAAAQTLAAGKMRTPWDIWAAEAEAPGIGLWRAFQAAFLLMSIPGLVDEKSEDRDTVDLIWFPTGGGKTEAYLAVASFYMFHQRLIAKGSDPLRRDGTNVFMRYTLRMLTTQQFQRAASLICAMEQIRVRAQPTIAGTKYGGRRFSLGLWIGGDGSPNSWEDARNAISRFRRGDIEGNPLVLTECPWCRSAIGRIAESGGGGWGRRNEYLLAGISEVKKRPYLKCSDPECPYGHESSSLPIEVIDDAIYSNPPSMFIGTADKFAMMAWKPVAGALFGFWRREDGEVSAVSEPPGLIIQDEFHLISGPLGTIYGLYEGVIEKLCTAERQHGSLKPKIIASTATIRGAGEQVRAVYARDSLQLFPSPGLEMGDSFFGRYEKTEDGGLSPGRLYLGIHATGYRSFLTTQVRAFSAALFRPSLFADEKKDAWWTLLAFYNSLRELGGARTLFTSDIAARIKDYAHRYGLKGPEQRYLDTVEELTSRRGQAELVQMMDRLALDWNAQQAVDACLASNIIEVGVDIDRLALMAVVGQPKSTAQYIQVTGRVGRRPKERPGLVLAMYNPSKSRDRSHFEQFHSYHRRLYERVEPTSATPYSVEAVRRALAGVLLLWARQRYEAQGPGEAYGSYQGYLAEALEILLERCGAVLSEPNEADRVQEAMQRVSATLQGKWRNRPQQWWAFPQKVDGEYLMLWPGQYATPEQRRKGENILSSMRNVDGTARAVITDNYFNLEQDDHGQ